MKKIFYLLYIITTSFFMACEKEEHLVNKNNEQLPQNPKDTVQNKFIFQWDTLIDDSKNDDEFFIGNQYIRSTKMGMFSNSTSHICRSNIS